MELSQVACVLVTRGNVSMESVLDSLPKFRQVAVWDNSVRPADAAVFGRYLAISEVRAPFIYTQDDDALCPAAELVESYDGDGLTVNVPPGEHPWLAWGGIFPRDLPFDAFKTYWNYWPLDRFFHRWADVAFAHLTGWDEVDLGHVDLPWATASDRMYHEPEHYPEQDEMRRRAGSLVGVLQ